MTQKKKGVLLINLGTPDDCKPSSVRKYLTTFLNDPRVVDLPFLLRWPLVNLFIVPFRFKKTTKAYQQIWQKKGSPLRTFGLDLKEGLACELGEAYAVELGMRYGNPSINMALDKLWDCHTLHILPLFPQYSAAATGSAITHVLKQLTRNWNLPAIKITRDFYAEPGFVAAFAEVIKTHIKDKNIDLLLFSYHGLPERQIDKSHCRAACDRLHPCPPVTDMNLFCYRAQCYATSREIAKKLGLKRHQYQVSFQSRLGRTPWIKPYTDKVLANFREIGINHLAVVCPSFVADCLETLEEVNIRTRAQWLSVGGEQFTFIPCINASSQWVKGLVNIITK